MRALCSISSKYVSKQRYKRLLSEKIWNACNDGDTQLVQRLPQMGADVNTKCENSFTPLIISSQNGHLEIVKVLIAAGGDVNQANKNGDIPLHIIGSFYRLDVVKLEVAKVLIAKKSNFLYKNNNGFTPLDVAKTCEIKKYIMNHPWYRRRSLLVTRPHSDHETNKEHKLKPLGEIITATPGIVNDPSSQDYVLFQLKIKIASFL